MSRFRVLAAGMAVGLLATLLVSSPASAHDELVESSPTEGHVFEAAPTEVSLTFSGEVMTMGAIVVVVDENGRDWVDGEPALSDVQVVANLQPNMPDAGYEVRWRVVSADGHPISGVIPFTIGDGEPFERESVTPEESDAGATGATGDDVADAQSQNAQENGVLRSVLIGAGGAILAIAVFALFLLLRRRAKPRGTGASDS